jgi:hypothetical protein
MVPNGRIRVTTKVYDIKLCMLFKFTNTNVNLPLYVLSMQTPILGVGVLMDSQIFRERLHGSKPIRLKSYLYQWKGDV